MKTIRRVLVISSECPPLRSPESAHTAKFCEELARQVESVCLITADRPGLAEFAAGQRYQILTVAPDWNWRTVWQLIRLARRFKPDGILLIYLSRIFHYRPAITFAPLLCKILVPRAGFVTLFENVLMDRLRWGRYSNRIIRVFGPRRVHPVMGRLLIDSQAIIGLSPAHIQKLQEIDPRIADRAHAMPVPPIMTVPQDPDGVLRQAGRRELGIDESITLIAYFGYIYVGKGIETLLRAAGIAISNGVCLSLVIIGGVGDERYNAELQTLAASLGLSQCIHWTGYCEHERASLLMRAADLCVLPFDEGLRLNNSSFATAIAYGLPVVSTRATPGEPELRHGENVWLVERKNPAEMANAIAQLASDKERADALSLNAVQFAREIFSWEKVIPRTLELMNRS